MIMSTKEINYIFKLTDVKHLIKKKTKTGAYLLSFNYKNVFQTYNVNNTTTDISSHRKKI